jgi:hypothetical protein
MSDNQEAQIPYLRQTGAKVAQKTNLIGSERVNFSESQPTGAADGKLF